MTQKRKKKPIRTIKDHPLIKNRLPSLVDREFSDCGMAQRGITIAEERRRGEKIIELLDLKSAGINSDRELFYRTDSGTKTALGLYRTMRRLVIEGE